jgi:hypothetical protein
MRDSDLAQNVTVASASVCEAVAAGFGALLADRDVAEIGSLEGGSVDVLRRGRRERLDVILEGPLFALLREAGAETDVLTLRLPSGDDLIAGPLADGRVALRVRKATPLESSALEQLIEEGVLHAGIDVELRAAVLEGAGVAVIGPARVARRRVLVAIVRSLSHRLSFFGVTDTLSSLLPVPLAKGALVVDKARAAVALGCDALCALDISPREAIELVRAELGVPLVVAVATPSMDALAAAFRDAKLSVSALAGTTAVIGHGPDGGSRLVELHGPTRAADPVAAPPVARDAGTTALPDAWASEHADDDPGWELVTAPDLSEPVHAPSEPQTAPRPGSFDEALASKRGKPSFAPRRAASGQAMRTDPFGGLTLEPPPGGPVDDPSSSEER